MAAQDSWELVIDGLIYQLQAHGGISRIFSEIMPRMCRLDRGLSVQLLMTGKSRQPLPRHSSIRVHTEPAWGRFLKPQSVWQPLLRRQQANWMRSVVGTSAGKIWHSTYYTMPEQWRGQQVVTVADMASELFPEIFAVAGAAEFREHKRRCVLAADAVICISEATREDVLRYYGIDPAKARVTLLACGDVFRQLPEDSQNTESPVPEPFLLYVGSRSHYKNFRLLLEAYTSWRPRGEVALLVVGGGGWSPQEKERLAAPGLAERVRLLPDTDDITLCQLYNRATALVYPSIYEGFGIPLLEAMACGCPVVASRIPATVEVAGDCPVYFEAGEKEDMVTGLDKVLGEGRKSARVSQGLARVQGFSWEKTAQETLQIYHRLLDAV